MPRKISVCAIVGLASASLLIAPVAAAPFSASASSSATSGEAGKTDNPVGFISYLVAKLNVSINRFSHQAGHSSDEKNEPRYYSEKTCTEDNTPIQDETESDEPIVKAEAPGPEPVYFGF